MAFQCLEFKSSIEDQYFHFLSENNNDLAMQLYRYRRQSRL